MLIFSQLLLMQQRVAGKIGPAVRKVEIVSLHTAMVECRIIKGNRLRITAEYSEHVGIVARIPVSPYEGIEPASHAHELNE